MINKEYIYLSTCPGAQDSLPLAKDISHLHLATRGWITFPAYLCFYDMQQKNFNCYPYIFQVYEFNWAILDIVQGIFIECGYNTYKIALFINLVISFVFFRVFKPIDSLLNR